jgi:predicted permease
MQWIGEAWRRLAFFFRRGQFQSDLEEEMAEHVRMKAKDLSKDGIPSEEAQCEARREFGSALLLRERSCDVWGFAWLETLLQDLHYGLRQLRRDTGFTAVAIITLALGIGANTAVFSIVDAVLLRPLPYKNANRLTFVTQRFSKERIGAAFDAYREFEAWSRYSHSFEKLAAATWVPSAAQAVLSWRGEKREMLDVPVSADFFSMLGVHAAQGRTFEAADLKDPCTVVLTHGFWQQTLGGASGWVGKSLTLNGISCTVVGVMPKDFSFYPKQTQLWTLITPESDFPRKAWDMPVCVLGLLKRGITHAGAQAELTTIENRIINENASLAAMKLQPNVLDLRWEFTWLTGRNLRSGLILLFAAVICVLLIACVNVANLLLGRASERQKEFGVRAALGSGRARLIRQLLTESVLLSVGGAILGTVIAVFCVRYIATAEALHLPPGNPVSVNWEVLGFTVVLAIVTGTLFGLVPAWKASRLDWNSVLKESARTASGGALSQRTRRLLVVAEMALSLVVLAAAALLIESLVHLVNAPLGYQCEHLLEADIRLPASSYPKAADWTRFWDRARLKVESVPGAKGVAVGPYLMSSEGGNPVTIQGTGSSRRAGFSAGPESVSEAYFHVLGIPLMRGREFDDRDRQGSMPVAIVNQAFATKFFPSGDALGQDIKMGKPGEAKPWLTIIGVVGNVSHPALHMGYDTGPCVYRPLRQASESTLSLFIRTAGSTRSAGPGVRRAIAAVDSNLPWPDIQSGKQLLSWFIAEPQFRADLLGIFGALALLLASVGVYGVLSQVVVQRTHEIGIRVALGARRSDVMALVFREGLTLTVIGIAIGIAASAGVMRLLSSMLYGVKSSDPLTFAVISSILASVALAACYIPARRATKVDPMVALRHE